MKTLLVRPVLVESKERTNLWSYKGRRLYYNQANFNDEDETAYYRAVLVSLDPNDKIERGNKVVTNNVDYFATEIQLCTMSEFLDSDNIIKFGINNQIKVYKFGYNKVIATQDQLSPDLMQKLVDEYNNGGMQDFEIIGEMLALYGKILLPCSPSNNESNSDMSIYKFRPKLTNGFVTVVEKEHNIPYQEEPIEEDGELVYSDGRFGILNDPKINGVDYENTPVPNYEESEDIFSKHKGSLFFSDETIEKMTCFPTIKCLDKKLPCYNHNKCMLDDFLELHNKIIYVKNNDSNLYTEEEVYNLIKKFDTCYMGKFMGPDAREEWFNNNKKK